MKIKILTELRNIKTIIPAKNLADEEIKMGMGWRKLPGAFLSVHCVNSQQGTHPGRVLFCP